VIVQMSISLDGYVTSDRAHPGATVAEDHALVDWKLDRISAAGAHLMGRVAYQQMAGYWPSSTEPYAAPMNDIPKVVFSKSIVDANWSQTRIARGVLATEIAVIKEQPGPDVIAYGGATFAAALASQGLVDEYCLVTQPLAVGRGQALFADIPAALNLELVEAISFECGVVVHIYRPQPRLSAG
jgi:dihydrofolate reductase